ncbi:glycosyltransferase family 4 protein [Curtobacterium oceanosedimentum]|uniref:glycosyltransferase family 4 protein n=1 Tax=Curtobacterium oceanosedimentum TaxID=465820 RepID=UPI000ADD322E|nr:glycosyltransferase family 1 protein [Curtobacterium oceanosedimentum]
MTDTTKRSSPIYINEAFRGQKTTGQQRYAAEIADRLSEREDFVPLRPSGRFRQSRALSWLWTLGVLPWRARNGVLVSLTSRTPLRHGRHVVVVHDLFVLTNPEWYSRRYVQTHAPLLRGGLRGAEAVIAVSEPVARQVRERNLTKAPIVVAPNAASEHFDGNRTEADMEVLDRLDLRTDGYLLAVGSIEPRKNLDRLVAAYAALPEAVRERVPLVLVGGGSEVFRRVTLDDTLGLRSAGYVSDADLAVLYRRSRGVVFPSLAEGFGLPIVEARRAGASLAVSDIEVFRWIADDEVDYFDPLSEDAIRGALERLIDGQRPGGAGTRERSGRFSWAESAEAVARAAAAVRT